MESNEQNTLPPEPTPSISLPRGHNEALKEEAFQRLNAGQSIATVAAALAIPQIQIRIWIHASPPSFKREVFSRSTIDNRYHRFYDDAFKQEAFRLIQEGISIRKLSQQLSVSQVTLHKWKKGFLSLEQPEEEGPQMMDYNPTDLGSTTHSSESSRLHVEIASLHRQITSLQQERDALKKVLQIYLRIA